MDILKIMDNGHLQKTCRDFDLHCIEITGQFRDNGHLKNTECSNHCI